MCGRFVLTTPAQALAEVFEAAFDAGLETAPRYNIAPMQNVVAVRVQDGRRRLVMVRWGLVPAWAKDPAIGNRMINARAESAAEKPSFRTALARRRCIVPASGFYEWQRQGTRKQPWYFHARLGAPLAIAAIWERWRGTDAGREETLETCALLTTAANGLLAPIHDRMPVLLAPKDYPIWLDPGLQDSSALGDLLVPAAEEYLVGHPVRKEVGDARHDRPDNIEPAGGE